MLDFLYTMAVGFLGFACGFAMTHWATSAADYLQAYGRIRRQSFAAKRDTVTRWRAVVGRVRIPRPSIRGWFTWCTGVGVRP